MRDILRGSLGIMLGVAAIIASIVFLSLAPVSCITVGGVGGNILCWVCLVLSFVCFCAAFGIKYWIGRIQRLR